MQTSIDGGCRRPPAWCWRPGNRALYCYARLVDELGDSYEGDRLGALDDLEEQVRLTVDGEPSWPVLRNVQPTVCEIGRASCRERVYSSV